MLSDRPFLLKGQSSYSKMYVKSSDAKASKCHLKFSSKMTIFIKLVRIFKFSNFTLMTINRKSSFPFK